MAAALRKNLGLLGRRIIAVRSISTQHSANSSNIRIILTGGGIAGTLLSVYIIDRYRKSSPKDAVFAKETGVEAGPVKTVYQSSRELRFLSFASVEYEGNVYMTPQDFLESVMEEAPRPRTGRTRLRKEEIQKMLKFTPHRWKGSTKLFRTLHDQGVISYTEYLFLLCVLTKPRSGFRIAFNMFDTDGNQRVDKKEFRVILELFQRSYISEHKDVTDQQRAAAASADSRSNIWALLTLENIITQSQKGAFTGRGKRSLQSNDAAELPHQDTTLLYHFFGSRGTEVLKYEDFYRFMENLQTEVLELEFLEFARGMPTITEEEFAKILLHYTIFTKDEQQEYIERLRKRIPHAKGISFQNFKEFGQFLNNLDDFAIAMRMYTYADQPISESEFKRAVLVCTGQCLNDHLVHTVFQLFDLDGDGHLSHKEFISIMKDRLHRGFKSQIPPNDRWQLFRSCVKNEMKNA